MPKNELAIRSLVNSVRAHEEAYPIQEKILLGARGYRGLLNRHREQVQKELDDLRQLPPGSQTAQVAELQSALREIQTLDDGGRKLVAYAGGERGAELLATPNGLASIRSAVAELMASNSAREFHRMRVQGPLMEAIDHRIDHCGGRHADAIIGMLDYLNQVAGDGQNELGGMWRFMTPADAQQGGMAIWLYLHHPTQKYRTMYFRLSVQRYIDSLVVNLESYVPFGSLGDPADYKRAESQAYKRAGWIESSVLSHSANLTETTNLNWTRSSNFGKTLGDSVTDTLSTGTSESDTTGTSESLSKGSSLADSTNWGENWSYSSGPGGSTNSHGGSSGAGTTYTSSDTFTEGTNASKTTGTTTGKSAAVSRNTGTSYGISLSECEGISNAKGKGVQVSTWNSGIDLGESNKTHLERWKQSHSESARQYKGVHDMFKTLCQRLERDLRQTDSSGEANKSVEARAREITSKVLVKLDVRERAFPGQRSVGTLPAESRAIFEQHAAQARQAGLLPSRGTH